MPNVSRGLANAFSLSATLLLLMATASLASVTWTVTASVLEARAKVAARVDPSPWQRGADRAERPSLESLGPETHDAEALWARAEKFAAAHGDLTLVRATVAPEALLDARARAALLGIRRGDVITAVNGYAQAPRGIAGAPRTAADEGPEGGIPSLSQRGGVVVELTRHGRPVALRIRTPEG